MYKLITAPSVEPITAASLYSKIGARAGDMVEADLDAMIASARHWVEQYIGRALITQTWELALDAFPCADEIDLQYSPVQSITSLKYLDSDGVEQTWDSSNYTLDDYGVQHRLRLAYGISWPSARAQANAVKLRYVAGYGNSGTAVPAPIIQAIVLIVGQAYRAQPGLETNLYPATIPNAARDLLAPYRILAF